MHREKKEVEKIAEKAFEAKKDIGNIGAEKKNKVLCGMARLLKENTEEIVRLNKKDLDCAAKKNIPPALVKRLAFDKEKITGRIQSLYKIASFPDPVGKITNFHRTENGLAAGRMRVPLGVVFMVYEARPHVTVNGGALCFKAGNAVILRGGSEAKNCNGFLGKLWSRALKECGLPEEAVQVISVSHEAVGEILKLSKYIDVVIPRGSESFVRQVVKSSRIPVIKHSAGICHIYIDEEADIEKSINIVIDSKCLMPAVCNAVETLLIAESLSSSVGRILKKLQKCGIQIRGCPKTAALASGIIPACERDWKTEYLDLVLSVKMVKNVGRAISHINKYGSHHTDAIVTEKMGSARQFINGVDSAVVLLNASTMFCDGQTLGMGAEVGISTDKMHARGPVGMEDLTTYKHIISGDGHIMGKGAI